MAQMFQINVLSSLKMANIFAFKTNSIICQ